MHASLIVNTIQSECQENSLNFIFCIENRNILKVDTIQMLLWQGSISVTAERTLSLPFEAGSKSFPSHYKVYFCFQSSFFLALGMFITFLNCHYSGAFLL